MFAAMKWAFDNSSLPRTDRNSWSVAHRGSSVTATATATDTDTDTTSTAAHTHTIRARSTCSSRMSRPMKFMDGSTYMTRMSLEEHMPAAHTTHLGNVHNELAGSTPNIYMQWLRWICEHCC